jgi:hypothetical protein
MMKRLVSLLAAARVCGAAPAQHSFQAGAARARAQLDVASKDADLPLRIEDL